MPPMTTASVAIDLGSSVITTVVGERNDHGQLHILGVGQSPSAGIEAGQISHVSRAADAIRHSLDQAEASSARQILSVGVAVSGAHLQSMNNRGAVALPSFGEPIRDSDLIRAIDSGRAVTINTSSTLLHAIPRYYVVDSERRSFDPRGQHGQRLDVSMHLVTASQSAIQNAAHCVQNAGVDVELIAAKPVVAAERAVRSDEKEFGALVIGLDAGTTTLTAFEDGAISHTSAIQIGTLAHRPRPLDRPALRRRRGPPRDAVPRPGDPPTGARRRRPTSSCADSRPPRAMPRPSRRHSSPRSSTPASARSSP